MKEMKVMSPKRVFHRPTAVRAAVALAASLMILPAARAQQPVAVSDIPVATDEQIEALGVRVGDYIIPYSSLARDTDAEGRLRTHSLLYHPVGMGTTPQAAASLAAPSAALGMATMQALVPRVATTTDGGVVAVPAPEVPPVVLLPAAGHGHNGTPSPDDLRAAYGVTGSGSGTIVVIGSYDYPSALSDFNTFSAQYDLPTEPSTVATRNTNQVFQVIYATGRVPAPPEDPTDQEGWNGENAMDIEWAHAMAPNAKIVLVLGTSPDTYNMMYAGVLRARSLPNVHEVSMSFGSNEFSNQTLLDPYFSGSGIVYIASTGDVGGVVSYPATSPNVVAVGGTTLNLAADGTFTSETAWNGSGGGVSQVEARPSYQNGLRYPTSNGGTGTTTLTRRGIPDISALADPSTGVYIVLNGSWSGVWGGTSLAAPLIAGIVNASGQYRSSSVDQLTHIYSNYSGASYPSLFRDITSGQAGSFFSGVGYDLVTGIGVPISPSAF